MNTNFITNTFKFSDNCLIGFAFFYTIPIITAEPFGKLDFTTYQHDVEFIF